MHPDDAAAGRAGRRREDVEVEEQLHRHQREAHRHVRQADEHLRHADVALLRAAVVSKHGRDRALQRAEVEGGRNPRDAKVLLAQEIVARFHSPADAERALEDFNHRAKGGVPDEIPAVTLAGAPLAIGQLLKQAGLVPSTSEALRNIEQGGVKIDGAIVSRQGLEDRSRRVRGAGRQAPLRARHAGSVSA